MTVKRCCQMLLPLCLLAVLLAGCAPAEPPALTVQAGERTLPVTCAKSRWDGAVYDREDVFALLAAAHDLGDLPLLQEGDPVSLTFATARPGEITVSGWILDAAGQRLTAFAPGAVIWDGRTGSWQVPASPAEGGICGVLLDCRWGDTAQCQYAFAYGS